MEKKFNGDKDYRLAVIEGVRLGIAARSRILHSSSATPSSSSSSSSSSPPTSSQSSAITRPGKEFSAAHTSLCAVPLELDQKHGQGQGGQGGGYRQGLENCDSCGGTVYSGPSLVCNTCNGQLQ